MRKNSEWAIEQEVFQTSLPQEASASQADRSENKERRSTWRWMRYFYTEDVSPDNYPVIDLQRRATWVGVALVLQALNEIDPKLYAPYVPYLPPWSGCIPFVLVLGSFVAMWMAFRTGTPKQHAGQSQDSSLNHARPRRWQRIVLVCVALASIAGGIEFGRSVVLSFFSPPQYSNDGTSLDTNAAVLLLKGHNPYTDSNIINVVRQFPIEPYWTTPLRVGQFANRFQYPSTSEFRSVLDTDLKTGYAPEFESKVSYPALSFLTLVPFIWLNIFNVLALYLISYIVLVAIAWKVVRPEMRPWVILLSLANVSMWTSIAGGNLDVFNSLLILLAWLLRERGGWSAIFLGLSLATKQLTWFFIPFYIMMVWRQYNLKEAARRLTIAGGIALAINLPFILWNLHAWIAGIMAPIADPMFPMGVGIMSLSTTPLLPLFPQIVYDVLELVAIIVALVWYWQLCKKRPEAAIVLAVIPLFFAWRSLASYFYCSAYPLFILMAARSFSTKSRQSRQTVDRPVLLTYDHEESLRSDLPAPVGARVAYRGIYYFRTWTVTRIAFIRQGSGSMLDSFFSS